MSLEDLKKAMKTHKLVFGTRQTLSNLKKNKTKVIFLANNCGKKIEEDVNHYAKISGTKVVKINKPRSEISVFCKKNFPVSVISY